MHVRAAHLAESSDEGLILRHGKLTPGMSIYSLFQQDSYMHKPIMHTYFLLDLCVTRRSLSSECRWTQSLGGRAFQELSHCQPPAPRGSLPEQGGNFVPRIIPKNLGALHRYANTCMNGECDRASEVRLSEDALRQGKQSVGPAVGYGPVWTKGRRFGACTWSAWALVGNQRGSIWQVLPVWATTSSRRIAAYLSNAAWTHLRQGFDSCPYHG